MKYLVLLPLVIMLVLSACNHPEPVVVAPAIISEPVSPQSNSGDQRASDYVRPEVVTDENGRAIKVPPAQH